MRAKRNGKIGLWRGLTTKRLAIWSHNTLSQNVQDIRQSHKVYRENMGKLESRIESRRKKFSWGKNPERNIPGWCSVIIICYSNDATQSHTQEMRGRIQNYKISRKDQSPNVYGRLRTVYQKMKKGLETLIQAVRIYSQEIGMEFGIERCATLIMRYGKRHRTEGIELPNQEKIKTLGEKETYKYLGTLEADTMKQLKMKEKFLKSILGEQESYSKPN